MSLRINLAATRAYDRLKQRPGAVPRLSDARDLRALEAVAARIRQLAGEYRINGDIGPGGQMYVFWTEIDREIQKGAFDDLLREWRDKGDLDGLELGT